MSDQASRPGLLSAAAARLLGLARPLRQQLGRIEIVRKLRDDADILVKYGRLRPECVRLARSTNRIFVNPREPRGRAILRGFGAGQGRLKSVWRRGLELLDPTIALDVGANYGEFLFLTDYRADVVVVGVEADPELFKYLTRSRVLHPQQRQIELSCALACDAPGEPRPFYIDTDWSGRSSGLQQEKHLHSRVEMVPTTSIDALLDGRVDTKSRLLFKIDVEGFEPQVLDGMEKTLDRASASAGLLEYNTQFLRKVGVDPASYLRRLMRRFEVRLLVGLDPPVEVTEASLARIVGDDYTADLALATDAGLLARMTQT